MDCKNCENYKENVEDIYPKVTYSCQNFKPKPDSCPACHGTGFVHSEDNDNCTVCESIKEDNTLNHFCVHCAGLGCVLCNWGNR